MYPQYYIKMAVGGSKWQLNYIELHAGKESINTQLNKCHNGNISVCDEIYLNLLKTLLVIL